MKKPIKPRKLPFVPTTLRHLRPDELPQIVGGGSASALPICDNP